MKPIDEKNFLQTVIDGIPDSVMVIRSDYRLILTNRAAREAAGETAPEDKGLTCYEFSHRRNTPCEGKADPCPLARVKLTKQPHKVIHTHYDTNGNQSIVEIHSAPVFTDDGEIDFVIETSRDITGRIRAEEKRALLTKAIEQATEMVVITDVNGIIEYASPAVEKIAGYPIDEVIGQTPRIFKSGKYQPSFYKKLWDVIQSGVIWSDRIVNCRRDGSLYMANLTITPVYDSRDEISHYVGVSRDVTREVELQMQLEQSRKLESIGRMAAGLAHEINTPAQFVGDNIHFLKDAVNNLNILIGDLQKLLSINLTSLTQETGCDVQRLAKEAMDRVDFEYLQKMLPTSFSETLEGIERITNLVGAIKEFGHPGSEKKHPADLNRAIQNTIAVARNEYKKTARIVTRLNDIPFVSCRLSELKQVFLNLIVNAAHAIASQKRDEEMGTIEISTRVENETVVISVSDDGPGIADEVRTHIFDPFYTTKEVGKGTGQGLAIAHSIVTQKHNGFLTMETELGSGTTFYVKLPISG